MSETCVIEIYENQIFQRLGGWVTNDECPYSLKPSMIACKPLEDISLPNNEWTWVTNWKISKMPGVTDADGWEYASRFSRFKNLNRAPKSEAAWSRARRRLWIRAMRREATIKQADLSKALSKVQKGLTSVHAARLSIEQIVKQAPEARDSEQMISIVNSVQRNIADLITILDEAEKQSGRTDISPAANKKLRHEIMREQAVILRALEKQDANAAAALTSSNSFNNVNNKQGNKPSALLPNKGPASSSARSNSVELRQDLQGLSQIVPNKGGVVSGQKGSFDPRIFASSTTSLNYADPEDGVFVERSIQELMIDQKLVAIDEATIMEEIIEDRSQEINKVHKGLVELNEVFVEISRLVKEQESDMITILGNTDESHARTKEAYDHIIEANRLHATGNCTIS